MSHTPSPCKFLGLLISLLQPTFPGQLPRKPWQLVRSWTFPLALLSVCGSQREDWLWVGPWSGQGAWAWAWHRAASSGGSSWLLPGALTCCYIFLGPPTTPFPKPGGLPPTVGTLAGGFGDALSPSHGASRPCRFGKKDTHWRGDGKDSSDISSITFS